MIDTEYLANQVAANQDRFAAEENAKGRNYMVPKPPKRGELIYCTVCGKPMYPQDFSSDPKIRKREFKWHIHKKCEDKVWDRVDMETPGLLAERTQGLGVGRFISPYFDYQAAFQKIQQRNSKK